MEFKKAILVTLSVLFLIACSGHKPLQPPPHPAELWVKPQYTYGDVLQELKACGWVAPVENVDATRKINMNVYAEVDACMQEKGFRYVGRTPLTCKRLSYKNLPACRSEHGQK